MKTSKIVFLIIFVSLMITSCEVTFFPKGAELPAPKESLSIPGEDEDDGNGEIDVDIHINTLEVLINGSNTSSLFTAMPNDTGLTNITYQWTVNGLTVACTTKTFVFIPPENKVYILSCICTAYNRYNNYVVGTGSIELNYKDVDITKIK